MVPNAEGELLTPSIVLFGDSEVVVGKSARSAVTHPSRPGGAVGQARHGGRRSTATPSAASTCRPR